jgi:hypothetical protein
MAHVRVPKNIFGHPNSHAKRQTPEAQHLSVNREAAYDRMLKIAAMRRDGATYKEIGKAFNICAPNAARLVKRAKHHGFSDG